MSRSDELTKDKIIKLQADVNHSLRDSLDKIKRRAESTRDYCKMKNLKPSKLADDIIELCEVALAKLDSQYARLETMKSGVKKGQTKLDGD